MIRVLIAAFVLGVCAPVHADSLAVVLQNRIGQSLGDSLALVDLRLPKRFARLQVRPENVDVEWVRAPKSGRSSVRFTITGKKDRKGWASIELREMRSVWVAKRGLSAGTVIRSADVSAERRSVSGTSRSLRVPVAVGRVLRCDVAAGKIIEDRCFQSLPPVARGTQVRVRLARGRVLVQTTGVLQRMGRVGQLVPVRIDKTKSAVTGRLVDRNTLEVAR